MIEVLKDGENYAPSTKTEKVVEPDQFQFAAAFLDHGHIYGQCNGLCDAGATIKWAYDPNMARCKKFCEAFPTVRIADSFNQILDDPMVQLVASAAVPNRRAQVGCQVMDSGKHYFTDKSPFTNLKQLNDVKHVIDQTGKKYMVYYAERIHNDAAWITGDLIDEGIIGKVLQVLTIAPHRLNLSARPKWFLNKSCYGGILTDLGSHQVEQFLHYAGCSDAIINFARVENFYHSDSTGLEDFGEISMTGCNGTSFYTRVDWFSPDGLRTWGDGRTFILGTEGTIELRKYLDVARQAPSSKIFLVNGESEQEIDCLGRSKFPFFAKFILDCINGTEFAMTQDHALKAAELSMRAQEIADSRGMSQL
ncbi:MAG: Gfo/Idh/MocA family oxidoreductase [Halieaceae bacterium]|nr:Gfo/Idh/MocA family oxidoreductase [Halieaceae bacterium]